jgi:hypothetical protein
MAGSRELEVAADAAGTTSLIASGTHALVNVGNLQASRFWFEAAYDKAELANDVVAMGVAALGLSGLWVHEHRGAAASALVRTRLEHASSRLDPGSALGLRLRARLAGEADYRAGTSARILSMLDEIRGTGYAVAHAEALSLAHHCLLGPDHGAVRRDLAEELIAASARTGRRVDLLMGLLWNTVDLFFDGDPHAERRLVELRDLLAINNHRAVGFVVSAIEVMLAIRSGRLDRAEALARTCAERGAEAGDIDVTGWYGAQMVAIRWYQGRLTELLPMLTDLVNSPTLSAVDNAYVAALAVAAAQAGDRPTAISAMARLRGRGLAKLPRSSSWLATMYGFVEAANLLGNVDAAARAYTLLKPYAKLPTVASLGAACFGSVQHALGVAALTTGAVDQAVDHLREAVHHNLALAHWPAVIRSRLRFAEALKARMHQSDAAAADNQLVAAADEASTLGLPLPIDVTPQRSSPSATCTRQGSRWQISLGEYSASIRHCVGMLHLAVLIANPDVEIAAIDLVAGVGAPGAAEGSLMSAQPVLDRAAIDSYRQRLADLRNEIEDSETDGDAQRLAEARAERDWLLTELSAGTGLAGRVRSFSDDRERARVAVSKAIRRAIARIRDVDAVIGEHLTTHVLTGTHCSYRRR